jgi:hypothetical protein
VSERIVGDEVPSNANELNDPLEVARAFAAAAEVVDLTAAEALVAADTWSKDHGDTPARLFAKATHEQRGFTIAVKDMVAGAEGSRAAVRIELIVRGEPRGELHLLGEGEPWRIGGVTKKPALVAAYLEGKVPCLLAFDELPLDADAAESVVAIGALATQAAHGSEQAAALVASLMNESADAHKVVGWLQQAARVGVQVRVRDARKIPGLNLSIVKADVVKPDPNQPSNEVWLYARSGPPIAWYAQTSYFSPDTLLNAG